MKFLSKVPVVATSMLYGLSANSAEQVSILKETKALPNQNHTTNSLSKLSGAKIVAMYGEAQTVRVHRNGDVERIWALPSGQLHMTNRPRGGKVTSVKFYENARDMPKLAVGSVPF